MRNVFLAVLMAATVAGYRRTREPRRHQVRWIALALGLARWRGRGSGVSNFIMLFPLVTPEIVMGVALLLVLAALGIPLEIIDGVADFQTHEFGLVSESCSH